MRTSAPAPTTLPGNSAAPVARKHPSPTRVPFRCACGPTSTSVPIIDACLARPRTRAFSMTTVRSPTRISPSSAVSTAPNKMRASAPTKTAPHKTAVGATYALGWTCGALPRCSISIHTDCQAHRSSTAGDRIRNAEMSAPARALAGHSGWLIALSSGRCAAAAGWLWFARELPELVAVGGETEFAKVELPLADHGVVVPQTVLVGQRAQVTALGLGQRR